MTLLFVKPFLFVFSCAAESDENEEDTDNKDGIKKEGAGGAGVKQEKDGSGMAGEKKDGQSNAVKSEKELKEAQRAKEQKIAESEMVRDLKAQLKCVFPHLQFDCLNGFIDLCCFRKAMNDQKEMKLLLDMYKGVSKEQRDKVQLMAIEKKLRSEIDDLRNQLKKMQVIGRGGGGAPVIWGRGVIVSCCIVAGE